MMTVYKGKLLRYAHPSPQSLPILIMIVIERNLGKDLNFEHVSSCT